MKSKYLFCILGICAIYPRNAGEISCNLTRLFPLCASKKLVFRGLPQSAAQLGKIGDGKRLPADVFRKAARPHSLQEPRLGDTQGAQAVDQGLAALGEARPHHPEEKRLVRHHRRGLGSHREMQHRRGHLGLGDKAAGRHVEENLRLGVVLAKHREGAIVRRARRCADPLGDLLSFSAALLWAFYSLVIKKLNGRYSTAFITRKIFFYGIITLLPMFFYEPLYWKRDLIFDPVISSNLLFLGVVASMLCYMLWNVVLKHLGTVRASNYIYFNPVVTLLASSLVLNESLTAISLVGAALVLGGVFIADRRVMKE